MGDFLMQCRWWLSRMCLVRSWKMKDACYLGRSAVSFRNLCKGREGLRSSVCSAHGEDWKILG